MSHVLVVGGGLSGCTAALELASKGQKVTLIEKTENIGGKVRSFGCKAADNCKNCGVCLAGGLWEAVEKNSSITILNNSVLVDVAGYKGNFSTTVKTQEGYKLINAITAILVTIGFERSTSQSYGNLEFIHNLKNEDNKNIITGFQLEKFIAERNARQILPAEHSRIAFIQCFGSRDVQEKAAYCSRVCCGYTTKAAKALKHFYPKAQIVFFYMDLQYVEEGQYFEALNQEGFEFIKCRPIKVKPGDAPKIFYEHPETGEVVEREFDLVVLAEGIRPPSDAEYIAELCTIGMDDRGFLKDIGGSAKTGVYIAGCASGPKKIEEVYRESLATARKLIADSEIL